MPILRTIPQALPVLDPRQAQHLNNLTHLVPLKRHRLLAIHLRLLALEDGPEAQQLREDAADGPQVDRRRVVAAPEQQVRAAVPDRHDDLVAGEEGR